MAENKKSFVLYADLIHTVRHLSKQDAGELFMHILSYVNDENPVTENSSVKISFEPVKQQLKRDLKKWEEIREKRSEAGRASAIKRQQVSTSVDFDEQTPTNPTVSVTDNVTVTVKKEIQNNTLKGEKHFEHIKEFYSHPYEKQYDAFKKLHTKQEYENFQKFLNAMFRDLTIPELTTNFDKCIGIGDWKKNLMGKGFLVIKPALEKAIAAKEGNRENMSLRIKTFTNGLLDEKVFSK